MASLGDLLVIAGRGTGGTFRLVDALGPFAVQTASVGRALSGV
jgi:hypothetical protein